MISNFEIRSETCLVCCWLELLCVPNCDYFLVLNHLLQLSILSHFSFGGQIWFYLVKSIPGVHCWKLLIDNFIFLFVFRLGFWNQVRFLIVLYAMRDILSDLFKTAVL